MPKVNSFIGVMKTLVQLTKEEFDEMDHKLPRIVMGVVSFAAAALFWLYFLRHVVIF